MKSVSKVFFILITISLFHSFAFSQWVSQTSGTTQILNALQAIDANTVYVAGSTGIFLKTTNGGSNWISLSFTSTSLGALHFLNSATGYTAGTGGSIFKTTNGGANWVDVHDPASTSFVSAIFFTSAVTGYAGSLTGGIIKTTNSGTNWAQLTSGTTLEINDITFINAATGWFGCGAINSSSNNLIRKTTDAGVTWVTQLNVGGAINSIIFLDDLTGFASSTGQVYKTTNSGTNWNTLNPGSFGSINSISNGNNTAIIFGSCSSGKITKTTNSGTNWGEQTSGTTSSLKGIDFVRLNPSLGWAVGNDGTILKTTNGGGNFITSVEPILNGIPEDFSLSQNYPNPFNPQTKITFSIPLSRGVSEGRGVFTSLKVFDILGKEVALLVNENLSPGNYAIDFDASALPSGTYFYRLTAGGFTEVKKMTLVK